MKAIAIAQLVQIGPRSYVPPVPVTLSRLGALLVDSDQTPTEKWPAEMRRGYIRETWRRADADTSAYLVGQGVQR
jgi:hypothetical protein